MAIGHSARDTVEMLYNLGCEIIQKPFSVGARIEHPQKLINKAQYGDFAGNEKLGAADYKLACHGLHERGAYTFCMCPGGTVVAAASEKGGVIVNGMSSLARDGENANSALLVGIEPRIFRTSTRLREYIIREKSSTTHFCSAAAITKPRRSLWVIFWRARQAQNSAM